MILTGQRKSYIEDNKTTTQKTARTDPGLGLLLILQKRLDKTQLLEFSMGSLCTLGFDNARKQQIWDTDFQIIALST